MESKSYNDERIYEQDIGIGSEFLFKQIKNKLKTSPEYRRNVSIWIENNTLYMPENPYPEPKDITRTMKYLKGRFKYNRIKINKLREILNLSSNPVPPIMRSQTPTQQQRSPSTSLYYGTITTSSPS
jgi:hypothetical protein